ncbi:MAG: 50S ribosomal protein L21 [Verrucomicrobiota bacterium]|nr:50S ribosomal protein L21 [Verrucomicrobiota bacterium]
MAYAIIRSGGRQHRVTEGDVVEVDFLNAEVGKEGLFADVLMIGDGDNIMHGGPTIEGATVHGEVVEQKKDKKVIAFKFRRRKGYHRTVGHRRKLTRVRITQIDAGSAAKK